MAPHKLARLIHGCKVPFLQLFKVIVIENEVRIRSEFFLHERRKPDNRDILDHNEFGSGLKELQTLHDNLSGTSISITVNLNLPFLVLPKFKSGGVSIHI